MIDFKAMEAQFFDLRKSLDERRITSDEYNFEISKLTGQDDNGSSWAISGDGNWLYYNGTQWVISQKIVNAVSVSPVSKTNYPRNTLELLKHLAVNIPKRFLKTLPITITCGVIAWVLHTYLLVYTNQGFSPDTWLGTNILNVSGKLFSSTLLWTLVGAMIPMLISFLMRGENPLKRISAIIKMPFDIVNKNKENNGRVLPIMCFAISISLIFNNIISGITGAVAGGVLMSSVVSFIGGGGFFIRILKMIFNDVQVFILKKRKFKTDNDSIFIIMGASGISLLLIGLLKSLQPPLLIAVLINYIWIVFAVLGLILIFNNNRIPKQFIFLFGFVVVSLFLKHIFGITVSADDGGWVEAGGTLGGWIVSAGAAQAVSNGLAPTIGGMIGIIIGGIFGGGIPSFPDGFGDTDDDQGEDGEATTTSNADGSTTTTYSDGTTSTSNADGSTYITYPDGTTANTNPDGSSTTTYPDGTTTNTNPDGSSTTTYPDGTTSTTSGNSSTTTTNDDGSSTTTSTSADGSSSTSTTDANGNTTTTDSDGNTTTTTTDANGNTTTTDSDGNTTTTTTDANGNETTTNTNPDGSSTTTYPDGTTSTTSGNSSTTTTNDDGSTTTTNPDGTVTVTDPDGSITTTSTDGTTSYTDPNGYTTTQNPDGTVTYPEGTTTVIGNNGSTINTLPDGTVITENPDGSKEAVLPDGTTATKTPDGVQTTNNPDGSVTVQNPDGTEVQTNADGSVTVRNPDGTAVQTNSDGSTTTFINLNILYKEQRRKGCVRVV